MEERNCLTCEWCQTSVVRDESERDTGQREFWCWKKRTKTENCGCTWDERLNYTCDDHGWARPDHSFKFKRPIPKKWATSKKVKDDNPNTNSLSFL